jgi:hypothetical protein
VSVGLERSVRLANQPLQTEFVFRAGFSRIRGATGRDPRTSFVHLTICPERNASLRLWVGLHAVLSDEILSVLARKSSSRQSGFTTACRRVVIEAKNPVGSRTVCQTLEQRFPEVLVRHKDSIASVTTVLNRLADYSEVRCLLNENGRRVYEWITEREEPC